MLKWLLTIVIVVILLGLIMPRLRQRGGSGRLPGDVAVRWRGRNYFFPFATTILLSLLFIAVSRFL
ncbi:MAG: DUF2905 domain-containing protein [Rhodocyclaceae bacterium]|jgi:hypothetical protein